MKKLIALLLALCMVFAFAACQQTTDTQDPADESVETAGDAASTDGETAEDAAESDAATEETAESDETGETGEESSESGEEEYVPSIEGSGVSEADAWYYESVNETGSYTDDLGNEYEYAYAYPAFSDTGAETLNQQIESFCQPYVEEITAAADGSYAPAVLSISYQTGSCGSIRSVLVTVACDGDVNVYKTFNYNAALGAEASGSEILEAACIDEDTLITQTMSASAEKFIGLYGSISDGDFYDSQLAMTLSPDAYGKHMPLYFDDAGQLCFVARVYSMAGAAYYDYPLPVPTVGA